MQSARRLLTWGVLVLVLLACRGPVGTVVPTGTVGATGAAEPTPAGTTGPVGTTVPIRRPAVAGSFYPADPEALAAMVDGMLAEVEPTSGRPIALISPHAGYIYSGPVAAYAYAELIGREYEAVVLIGPNHYLRDLSGIAVYPRGAWETPLGTVPVDEELAQAILRANAEFRDEPGLHAKEHSLEVQLPFLQRALPDTPIVPILIGRPTLENHQALTEALLEVLPGRDVLLVASTDLSHYPAYEEAVEVDRAVLAAIETMDLGRFRQTIGEQMVRGVPNLQTTCCGERAVTVVMAVAPALGADRAAILHYANSGDVAGGDRDRVVGYGAVKFWSVER